MEGNVSSTDLRSLMQQVAERARAAAAEIETNPEVAARVARLQAEEAERMEQHATTQRESAWDKAGIPRRLWPMFHGSRLGTEEGPDPTAALDAVGRFLSPSDKATILVLAGGVGTGKTVAAAWGAAFHAGKMVKTVDLVRIGLFGDGQDKRTLRDLEEARVAVIDDVGSEPQDTKGYAYAAFFDAIERRYDAGGKTILTTNLTLDEFRQRYGTGVGVRFWDRIRGDARWVDIAGKSMRERVAS